jgi:uncharacterized phage protein gp47/JayE
MAIYGVKSKNDILISTLNSLEKNAGITAIHPGSIARAFAEAFSSEVSDLYEAFRFSINQNNLSTASGRNLDMIGDLYGIPRKSVTALTDQEAMSFNIQFSLSKIHTSDITISKNTLVYTDVSTFVTKQYSFKLAAAVTIPAGTLSAYGRVEPNFNDNAFVAPVNSLTKHNFIAPPTVVVFCSNPKEVYSNTSAESDANYRRRIIGSVKSRSAGTAESVRFAALSVKGVRDVRIREAAYGIGSCDIIVVPESTVGLKPLPQAILSAIGNVKPVGVRFNVRIAEKLIIGVSATITLSSGNSTPIVTGVRNQAQLFIKRYINSLTVGDIVSLKEIEQQIRLSSGLIRSVVINGFTADNKELPLEDFTLNTITKYPSSGNVFVNAAIISSSTY